MHRPGALSDVSRCAVCRGPSDYLSAKPDPVSEYSHHVIKHMNDDHGDATAAMLRHYVGIPVGVTALPGPTLQLPNLV